MDRSKFPQFAFKSNKSAEANAYRLCYEIRSFVHESESRKVRKSLAKYTERVFLILKGDHKLSRNEESKHNISKVFKNDKILEFVLTNITIFTLDSCQALFDIFFLTLDPIFEEYIVENIHSISTLLITPVSSLNLDVLCGRYFRFLMENRTILKALLTVNTFELLIQVACSDIFEIFSDACESLRVFLETEESCEFLNTNSLIVLKGLYTLCDKGYYSKRIALSILYEIVKNQGNKSFAQNYIENEENLKYVMKLMKADQSVEVKIEAFNLFAQQTRIISQRSDKELLAAGKIIMKNKCRIISFLEKFQLYREDQKFQIEKAEILQILKESF